MFAPGADTPPRAGSWSMATFHHALGDAAPAPCRGGAVTIGNFDGVHLGHQALIAQTLQAATGVPTVAVTFDPHPTQLLRPASFQPLLTTPAYRAELLQHYGIAQVLILRTTPALLQLSAREFFEQILREQLDARVIVEGFNFGFGKNREGTTATLQTLGQQAGIDVILTPPVEVGGAPVSTSRVRREIVAGAVDNARHLLGRCYRLYGVVGSGARRGATLGFPTANITEPDNLVPGDGVYAVEVRHGGRAWPGAANIGPNPTFSEQGRKIEVHLIGFAGDLYGQRLGVDFVRRLREPRAFQSVQDLTAQIRADVTAARQAVEDHHADDIARGRS